MINVNAMIYALYLITVFSLIHMNIILYVDQYKEKPFMTEFERKTYRFAMHGVIWGGMTILMLFTILDMPEGLLFLSFILGAATVLSQQTVVNVKSKW